MTNRIFISYRRADSHGSAGRIYDHLSERFGSDNIFMDVDTIQPGLDFVNAIESAVNETDVLLAVIGQSWLDIADSNGKRRLDNPEDFVRLEIGTALKRNIRVIPVLVDGALSPQSRDLPDDLKPLARRNAIEVRHTRFSSDIQQLVRTLESVLGGPKKRTRQHSAINGTPLNWILPFVALLFSSFFSIFIDDYEEIILVGLNLLSFGLFLFHLLGPFRFHKYQYFLNNIVMGCGAVLVISYVWYSSDFFYELWNDTDLIMILGMFVAWGIIGSVVLYFLEKKKLA